MEKSGHFHVESALYEIMRYCIKYQEAVSVITFTIIIFNIVYPL